MLGFTEPSAIYLLPCTTKLHFLEPGFPSPLLYLVANAHHAREQKALRLHRTCQERDRGKATRILTAMGFADSENSNAFGSFARGSGAIQQRRTRGVMRVECSGTCSVSVWKLARQKATWTFHEELIGNTVVGSLIQTKKIRYVDMFEMFSCTGSTPEAQKPVPSFLDGRRYASLFCSPNAPLRTPLQCSRCPCGP